MTYEVRLAEQPRNYIAALDEKSERIVTENLRKLEDDPYPRPGSGSGDKEKITVDGEEITRLHIGRTHTAFYVVRDDLQQVRVLEILPIDEAHTRNSAEAHRFSGVRKRVGSVDWATGDATADSRSY